MDSLKCITDRLKCIIDRLKCIIDSLKCIIDSLRCIIDRLKCIIDSLKCITDRLKYIIDRLRCIIDSWKCVIDSSKCRNWKIKYIYVALIRFRISLIHSSSDLVASSLAKVPICFLKAGRNPINTYIDGPFMSFLFFLWRFLIMNTLSTYQPFHSVFNHNSYHYVCFVHALLRVMYIFIRPSSDGTYYGMVMSVRVSVRPSVRPSDSPSVRSPSAHFPHFSPTCFDILSWNFAHDFVLMYYRSSSTVVTLRQFLKELCLFVNLE